MGKQSPRRRRQTICPDGPDDLADCYLHSLSGCIPCGAYVFEHDRLGRDGYEPPAQPAPVRLSRVSRFAVAVTTVGILWIVGMLAWTAVRLLPLVVS